MPQLGEGDVGDLIGGDGLLHKVVGHGGKAVVGLGSGVASLAVGGESLLHLWVSP